MHRAAIVGPLVLVVATAACGSSPDHAATTASGPHRVATVADARKAVAFPVPDPGTRLDRAQLTRIVVGRPADIGSPDPGHPVVTFFYSGGGITNARVEVGSPDSRFGRALRYSLQHDVGPRLVGTHFSAESEDDSYAFRCGDSMVFVSTYEPSHAAWARVLTRVARECPVRR